MDRKLKQIVVSLLFESTLKFSICSFISYIVIKLFNEYGADTGIISIQFKDEVDIMVGLSLIYMVFFIHDFYIKIENTIIDDFEKMMSSIRQDKYNCTYSSYEFNMISQTLDIKTKENIKKDKELIKTISYIAHDIKTPVTIINTNMSLIKNSGDFISDKNLLRMDRIYSESTRISDYISKIMEVMQNQIENNNEDEIKLNKAIAFLEKNIELYSDMLEETIEVNKYGDYTNFSVYANLHSLNECVFQLLDNAYNHKIDKIIVDIQLIDNKLEIAITDDGLGFDESKIEDSKKIFVTGNTGRISGKGYGIGLYYVNSYMEKIGGILELNNIEKGAVAKMIVPIFEVENE